MFNIYYLEIIAIASLTSGAFIKFRPINIRHVTLLFISFIGVSVVLADITMKRHYASNVYLLSMIVLFASMFFYDFKLIKSHHSQTYNISLKYENFSNSSGKFVYITSIVIFLLATYHLFKTGIPLFSNEILTTRFEHTGSGWFGVPGRMYQYGIYFAFFLTFSNFISCGTQVSKYCSFTAAIFLLFFLILSGNKGNVIQFAAAITVVSPSIKYQQKMSSRRKGVSSWIYIILGIIALFIFIKVSKIQIEAGSYRLYSSPLEALYTRIFEMSGTAFSTLVYSVVPTEGYGLGSNTIRDIEYMYSRFFDGNTQYNTVHVVSSYVTGRSLDSGLFIVPVTITAFGYGYFEFGVFGAIGIAYFLGHLLGYTNIVIQSTPKVFARASYMFIQMGIFWLITRGGIGNTIINLSGTLIVIFIIYQTSRLRWSYKKSYD